MSVRVGTKFVAGAGVTPHIGENGNWYIGTKDTGICAKGSAAIGVNPIIKSGTQIAEVTIDGESTGIYIPEFKSITSIIAEDYSDNSVYSTGKYCIFNSNLYKAIKDVPKGVSPEDGQYWELVNLGSELYNFYGLLSDENGFLFNFSSDGDTLGYIDKSGEFKPFGEGSGITTIVNVRTETDEWKGNNSVSVTLANSQETLSSVFNSLGECSFNVKFVGKYSITVIDVEGNEFEEVVDIPSLGSINSAVINGVEVYGYHYDGSDSNPNTRISYHIQYKGKNVKNYSYTPVHMDYDTGIFDYGDWLDALDRFIMPRPCMLKNDGTVDYYLNPNDYSKKLDGTASDISNSSYPGNAMVEWGKNGRKIWYKVVPDTNVKSATIYVSNWQADDGFVSYPFTDCNDKPIDHFYTRIYEGSLINSKTRSLSGVQPAHTRTYSAEVSNALSNNGDSSNPIWYTGTYGDWLFVGLLLTLLGKSTDTQSVFGKGNCSGYVNNSGVNYNKIATGTMNTRGMFWGSNVSDTSHLNGVKVFGMENWWGNIWERLSGDINDRGTRKIKLTYGTADGSSVRGYNETGSGYLTIGNCTPNGTSGGYISENVFTDKGMFAKTASGSDSTYDCDGLWFNNSQVNVSVVGGACGNGLHCGAFCVVLASPASDAYWAVGGSLSCKPLGKVG